MKWKKPKKFLGHKLTFMEQRWATTLCNNVHLHLGRPKRTIKTEADLWLPLERIYGFIPDPRLTFGQNIAKALEKVQDVPKADRRALVEAAGYDVSLMKFAQPSEGKPKPVVIPPAQIEKKQFYRSWEWRTLRMEVLKEQGNRCQCCGIQPGQLGVSGEPARIVVDHIKPLSKFWALRLEKSNLQVLCDECNMGKGAWDETDWRESNVIPFPTPIQRETA